MNLPVLVIAIGYFLSANAYFGWNGLPRSDAELICDGIGFILLALAFIREAA